MRRWEMKCSKCQFDNREGVKFCEKCGAKIEVICPKCGTNLPLDRYFCGECGADLNKSTQSPPLDLTQPQSYTPKFLADKIITTRSSIEGERKVVTVLFADVANYTSLSEKLDPDSSLTVAEKMFCDVDDIAHLNKVLALHSAL
jgi:hypothetical protein